MPPPPITTTLGKTWSKLEASATSLLPNSALMPTTPIASTPSSTISTTTSSAASTSAPNIMTVSGQTPGTPSGSNGGTPTGTPGGPPLGVSRRTHPKSRTGCRTCKIRKIKCDEERPSCRNCIKHGVKCPYTTPPSITNTPISTTVSPIPLNSMLQPGLGTPFTLHGDHDLNLVDLELLHNFTTATYATLSIDSLVRDVWRINVVRLGVQCDYVMRTILAVSALHMAHHRPEKRDFYFSRALTYHQMASQTATPLLSNLATSSEGWESLYIFSTLTIFFSLGSTKQPDMIHGESFPPWIYLLSGARSLVQLAWLRLDEYQGLLAPLFRHGRRRWELYHSLEHTVPISPELQELQERIIRTVADPHTRNIYLAATDDLARNMRVSGMAGMDCMPDITDAFVWVFADMDPFLAMLRAQTQESVAILAHFSVMIRQMENQWWLEGWSSLLLAKVWDVLDDEHKLWVQWPMEQVGWIPP